MSDRVITSQFHICATCTNWSGKQKPEQFGANVRFDPNERAKCIGGIFKGASTSAMQNCNKWNQRFTL